MSLLEIAFVSSLTAFLCSFFMKKQRCYSWIAILLSLSLVLFATHSLTEGYRWQMFPAYLLFFVMAVMSLIVFQELFPSDQDEHKEPSRTPFFILILILLVFLLAASWVVPSWCQPPFPLEYVPTRLYSLPELLEDFDVLKTTMKEAHGSLYAHIDPEDFELAVRKIRTGLNAPLTGIEFYRAVSPLVSAVRCGHTHILPSRGYEAFRDQKPYCLPYGLELVENRLLICDEVFPCKESLMGSEILAINDRETRSIMDTFLHSLSGDGTISTQKFRRIGRSFIDYYARYIERKERYSLKIKRPDGRIEKLEPPSLTRKQYEVALLAQYPREADSLVEVEFHLDFDAALLRMKTFYTVDLKREGVRYRKYFRNLFSEIEEKGLRNLILDIRGNAGGSLRLVSELLSYLMEREFRFLEEYRLSPALRLTYSRYIDRDLLTTFKWLVSRKKEDHRILSWHRLLEPVQPKMNFRFNGDVYVLIDGETFSAASMFASLLQSRNNTVFVGEETGGAACGSGVSPILLTLPNTRLRAQIPFGYVRLAVSEDRDCSRGVFPDRVIQATPNDRSSGRDRALGCVVDMILSDESEPSSNRF